jgi:hypothetical protein
MPELQSRTILMDDKHVRQRIADRKWYSKNKKKKSAYTKEWQQNNHERHLLNKRNSWARNKDRLNAQRSTPEKLVIRSKQNKRWRIENEVYNLKRMSEWGKRNHPKLLINTRNKLKTLFDFFNQDNSIKIFNIKDFQRALFYWSKTVKERDGNICQICGTRKGLISHHILFKFHHAQLSLNENNGITLCKDHHDELHRLNPMVRVR